MSFVYAWGNNPRRAELKGRLCTIVCVGRMQSCLLDFGAGELVVSSLRALRSEGEVVVARSGGIFISGQLALPGDIEIREAPLL